MVFPLGKITTLPPPQFLKFWETNILALGLGFESSVWVAFIARHGPAHSGSCWHGEIANFDFSGSSRGPGSVWTGQGECGCRQMPLSSQAASCTAPPGLEAHSCSITEPYHTHPCARVGASRVHSHWFDFIQRSWALENTWSEVSGCLFSSRFAWVSTAGLSLSCTAKLFLLVANQFCSPSVGTGDFYHLFSGPWRSCRLFFSFLLFDSVLVCFSGKWLLKWGLAFWVSSTSVCPSFCKKTDFLCKTWGKTV